MAFREICFGNLTQFSNPHLLNGHRHLIDLQLFDIYHPTVGS